VAEYDLGVCIFALNEEKFISYAIRSFLASNVVKCVAVIEGHVKGYPTKGVSRKGLSTDGTAKVVKSIKDDRVVFSQAGKVDNKAVLQNLGFDILQERLGLDAICGLAGADELYKPEGLRNVKKLFMADPALRCLGPKFNHFWWRPDLVATGGTWNVKMHRWYRLPGQRMKFTNHAAPPTGCNKPKKETGEVEVFHYVGMADAPRIAAKLDFYRKRDGHRLNVVDTWSKWKYGTATQWTHGGGGAERFTGEHPEVIADKVWELMPKDANGKKLSLPSVPWDEKAPEKRDLKIGVFLEDDRVPNHHAIHALMKELAKEHTVIIYPLGDTFPEAAEFGLENNVRGFSAKGLNTNDLVILFPDTIAFTPIASKHIAVLWKKPSVNLNLSGYSVFEVPGLGLGYPPLPLPADFIKQCDKLAPEEMSRLRDPDEPTPPRHPRPKPDLPPMPPKALNRDPALHTDTEFVYIRNVTAEIWKPNTHDVTVRWWNGLDTAEMTSAVKVNHPLPGTIRPGETLPMEVSIPRPPIQAGFLTLVIDIRSGNRMMNIGPRIRKFIK
jgi:hypothetical protein